MSIRTVGIIGYGHFGQFLYTLLQTYEPSLAVKIYSRRTLDVSVPTASLAEVAESDVVVLCVAIHEYEATLEALRPHLRTETVVVDVATVKGYTERLCKAILTNNQYVCTHPMFGPESYRKQENNLTGLRVVISASTLSPEKNASAEAWLTTLGIEVIKLDANEHDRLLAESLFVTHYVAQTLAEAGIIRTKIDTVSFGSLMNAVESVQHDRVLFEDVFTYNPHCRSVADRFHLSQEKVWKSLNTKPE